MKHNIIYHPSFNCDQRHANANVDLLVLHYTGMESAEAALAHMCDTRAQVSAHYMVDEDGSIYQLVDEQKRAWHAGISCWQGHTMLNHSSIGIEIVNPGHEFGYRAFPKPQMEAVLALSQDIIKRHNIEPRNVVGHSDIAPDRKQDPGELFDWQWLAQHGVGLWPKRMRVITPKKMLLAFEHVNGEVEHLQQRLATYGYHVRDDGYYGPKMQHVVTAFKRHFVPEQLSDVWDKKSDAVLNSLLQQIT